MSVPTEQADPDRSGALQARPSPELRPYWISWFQEQRHPEFELHSPWWISGYRMHDDAATICAAVMASDETAAKAAILLAHDEPRPIELEWRFVEEKPANWSPFSDRFRKAPWMNWYPLSDGGNAVTASPADDATGE